MHEDSTSSEFSERLRIVHSIAQNRSNQSQIMNCLHDRISELLKYKEENETLKAQLKIANETNQIQSSEFAFQKQQMEEEIRSLKDQINLLSGSLATIQTSETSLKHENSKLRESVQLLTIKRSKQKRILAQKSAENADLKKTITELSNKQTRHIPYPAIESQRTLLDHVELERDSISDMLDIETDPIDKKWTKLSNAISNLLENKKRINELSCENAKLKKRLSAALRDSTPSNLSQRTDNGDQSLRDSLHRARADIDQMSKRMSRMKEKYDIACHIEKLYSSLRAQLDLLHDTLFDKRREKTRAVILSVLFAQRLLRGPQRHDTFHSSKSLNVFTGRGEIEAKMRDICAKFTEITQELMITRQDVIDSAKERHKLAERVMTLQERYNDAEITVKIGREQVLVLKSRLLELQEELATLVSPELYKELEKRLNLALAQKNSLEEQVESLKSEVSECTKLAADMSTELDEAHAQQHVMACGEKKLRYLCEEKDREIESLREMLREKSREILALERVVMAQQSEAETADTHMRLLAVENMELLQHHLARN